MPHFSDIPKFIFERYINDILNKKPVKKDTITKEWSDILFTDDNDITWEDSNSIIWNLSIETSYRQSLSTDSYLQSPQRLIVTTGGKHVNAYAKTENGYKEVKLEFNSNYNNKDRTIGDIYEMQFSNEPYPVKSNNIRNVVEGENYKFTYYDAFSDPEYKTVNLSEEEKEVYVKKKEEFYEWFNSIDSFKGFMNHNKLFSFLGTLYPGANNRNKYGVNLERFLFKDFVIKSIPENNRKEKFVRFMETVFDQFYHKWYTYQKNLSSIIDYDETWSEFLNYLISIYNFPYIIYDYTDTDRIRGIAQHIPTILKKKGSFSSITSAWRAMAGSDTNVIENEDIINYEWWFTVPSGTKPVSAYAPSSYEEIPYLKEYSSLNTCHDEYFSKYSNNYDSFVEDKVLSPHYKTEIDLTCRPPDIDNSAVFSQKLSINTYNVLESLRPITRKSHYNLLFSPRVDFSGHKIPLYNKRYKDVWWNSLCTVTQSLSGSSIHVQNNQSDIWEIKHNLKVIDPLVQIVDNNGNLVIPDKIYNKTTFDPFKIYVEFSEPVNGYALVTRNTESTDTTESNKIVINNEYGKQILTQFYNSSREMYFVDNIKLTNNTIEASGVEDGYIYISESDIVWEQNTPSTTWNVKHNFGVTGTIVQVYDDNWNLIWPESITLSDLEWCEITFSEPVTGKVVLKEIGSLNIKSDIIDKLNSEGAVMYLGDGAKILSDNYNIQNLVKKVDIDPSKIYKSNDNLFIEGNLLEKDGDEFSIKECAILDKNENNVYFYSQGSEIFKNKNFSMTLFYRVFYNDL